MTATSWRLNGFLFLHQLIEKSANLQLKSLQTCKDNMNTDSLTKKVGARKKSSDYTFSPGSVEKDRLNRTLGSKKY